MIRIYTAIVAREIEHSDEPPSIFRANLWSSSCGIILEFKSDEYHCHRILGFHLDIADPPLARVQTARLALASINSRSPNIPIFIYLPDGKLLEEMEYPNPRHQDVLKYCNVFPNAELIVGNPNKEPCEKVAEAVRETARDYDSQTLTGPFHPSQIHKSIQRITNRRRVTLHD